MARLESAGADDRAPALPSALHGRWRWQPARRARALSRRHHLSHSRHQSAVHHRDLRLLGLHPAHQRGHHGPAFPRQGRHARGGAAGQGTGDRRDDGAWFVRRRRPPATSRLAFHQVRICRQGDSPRGRSPPGCAISMLWSRRASPLPMRLARPVYQRRPIIAGVRSSGHKTTSRRNARQSLLKTRRSASWKARPARFASLRPASKGHQDSAGFEE